MFCVEKKLFICIVLALMILYLFKIDFVQNSKYLAEEFERCTKYPENANLKE